MDTKHVPGETLDIKAMNIQNLKSLFPEAFTEGKIDFDKLKQLLGEYVDDSTERYNFTWNGKGQSLRFSQSTSTGTLRPCPEESKEWDTTKNLYIEGDNLEVLKLLQKSYFGKVKMIYIDPPYNTGRDFVYPDNFTDSIENYKRITGQIDTEGKKTSTNTEANGRFHTEWMNMMYPRLRLARNLLTEDGIIMLSIDEKEEANLKKICNEVFGEENFAGELIWKNTSRNDQDYISIEHEYFLIYVKSKADNKGDWVERKEGLDEIYKAFDGFKKKYGSDWKKIHEAALDFYKNYPESNSIYDCKHYSWMDEIGVYFAADISGPNPGQYVYDVEHPITHKTVKMPSRGWFCPESNMKDVIAQNGVHFGDDETTVPCLKTYLKNTEYKSISSVVFKDGRAASKRLKTLFGEEIFNNPKDELLLLRLFQAMNVNPDDIILDFFAGSSTTMHTAFLQNCLDNGQRKVILVQLPESIDDLILKGDEKSKKIWRRCINYLDSINKPHTICEIGKQRIHLVGDKIKQDNPDATDLDIGFKVLKLDTSNIKRWNPDAANLETTLEGSVSNWIPGRTDLDVVYEILIKLGLPLDIKVEQKSINGKTIYTTGSGALIVCLADGIDLAIAKKIIEIKETDKPETCKIVFRDNGFKTDSDKTNVLETLRAASIEEILSI